MKHSYAKIQALLYENDKDTLGQQLINASLFLMLFEEFKRFLESRIKSRFDTIKGRKVVLSNEYYELKEKYGKNYAIKWFYSSGAISESECKMIEKYTKLRNDIGHELLGILVDDTKRFVTLDNILELLELYEKLVKWWVKEYELTWREEYDNVNISSSDISSPMINLLRHIVNKSTSKA